MDPKQTTTDVLFIADVKQPKQTIKLVSSVQRAKQK
jgi:hypothetical protein